MTSLPVEQSDGCRLDRFAVVTEDSLADFEPSIPLTASLVVLWDRQECLMVFNRFRHVWELPGGAIDPGESAREAAVRELMEESGQQASALELAGVALSWYPPASQLERLAIHRGTIAERTPFVANDEMLASCWWDPRTPLADVAAIDAALVQLCGPVPGTSQGE